MRVCFHSQHGSADEITLLMQATPAELENISKVMKYLVGKNFEGKNYEPDAHGIFRASCSWIPFYRRGCDLTTTIGKEHDGLRYVTVNAKLPSEDVEYIMKELKINEHKS